MSVSFESAVAAPKGAAGRRRIELPRWLREPLLHFVVLGAVLFAADDFIASRADDPLTIVVDAGVDAEAIAVFEKARDRAPNEDELYALRRVWLDNEVLYREGLAMGLDRGDKSIRERVIFKALSVVDAGIKLPPSTDAVLREWFERNRAKYDEPARYDFQEAVPGAGARSESELLSFANDLNSGTPREEASLRVFTGRPQENLVQSYGAEFVEALKSAPVGEWRVLTTLEGPRVMRLASISAPQRADYEGLRGVVQHDWTDATMADQRSAVVRALAQKYTIKTEPAP